ncbi:hypothetical protein B7P43_G11110 [Cryptotermes secundus]|nr:hypothetical protein B7P43_G11110 [Cryptotermes secundus]
MTVGKLYAQNRLHACKIYCINSRVINVAGSINCVCFDKTGTLTEDGMDMWGVLPVDDRRFQAAVKDMALLSREPLQLGMASCHSLTLINGALSGDPLDVKMFEATGWKLEEPEVADQEKYDLIVPTIVKSPAGRGHDELPSEIALVHQFQFSSTLQRMSVVTRELGSQDFVLYCKGSPEMVVSLSRPETVPEELNVTLQTYTEQGYRVIALGRRTLAETSYTKIQRMRREDMEKDLEFLGMIVLENRLKPETEPVIGVLKAAHLKIVMITGDNILTAVSVAKECGIFSPGETVVNVTAVPAVKGTPARVFYTSPKDLMAVIPNGQHDVEAGIGQECFKLALTGKTWAIIRDSFPELVPRLCTRGAVFARMSSDQKQQLVQELQGLGYYVAMCGDGANDCGALKAAHVGISLSEAESSVASPFTSKDANISCVPKVIREGRAALSTSSGIFKFMVAYALTEFISCIILYAVESNLFDLQFLFIDICLIVNFGFFFGKTRAYAGPLVRDPPLTSLLSFIPLTSLTLHVTIITAVQLGAFFWVRQFPWYSDYKRIPDSYACYENYAVYCVSLFQYIASAVAFSQGKPYRKEIYTNVALMISLVIMTLICAYKTMYPAQWITDYFGYIQPPAFDFKVIILCLAVSHFVLVVFAEDVLVNYVLAKIIRPMWKKKAGLTTNEEKFLAVDRELAAEMWPPVTTELPIKLNASVTELRAPLDTAEIHFRAERGPESSLASHEMADQAL